MTAANFAARICRRDVGATPWPRRGYSVETSRGGRPRAATRIFRGRRVVAAPRLRRGYSADGSRRRRGLRRGYSADGSRRRRGCDVDIPWEATPRLRDRPQVRAALSKTDHGRGRGRGRTLRTAGRVLRRRPAPDRRPPLAGGRGADGTSRDIPAAGARRPRAPDLLRVRPRGVLRRVLHVPGRDVRRVRRRLWATRGRRRRRFDRAPGPGIGGSRVRHGPRGASRAFVLAPRESSVETGRGDAAVVTWIFRGDGSRRRRGYDVDIPWRPIAATPRLRRGYSVETGRDQHTSGTAAPTRSQKASASSWTTSPTAAAPRASAGTSRMMAWNYPSRATAAPKSSSPKNPIQPSPPPWNIHVVAAAPPRPACCGYPRQRAPQARLLGI